MLIIRPEQMAIFDEHAFNAFAPDAIEHLRTELRELTADLSDQELLSRVRACIPVAAQYGLSESREVMAFVDATYLLGDARFDIDPDYWWAPEILNCPYLTPMQKATQLLDSAFAENQLMDDE